ncbi:MAG TPA: methyltransferase domain-containing protein [Candidatus Limnocylindrales bacterium]|nr:methyltransferase domain-containing protein [Candidatus Limnocylindrales bacterium]
MEADPGKFRAEDTRATYDAVAERYAVEIADELDNKPFDREFLDRFADSVRDRGPVVDLGTGPGHVAAYLKQRGVEVSGLDLSPKMVGVALQRNPDIDFVVGSLLELPFATASMGGLVAFYSIVHFDDDQMERALAEMVRVLRPGGLVALTFHIGDEVIHGDSWWDAPIELDFRFLPTELVADMMSRSGLSRVSVEERDPYAPEVEFQSRRAYVTGSRLPSFELGYPRTDLRRKLTEAVLYGDKRATAGLAKDHAPHTDEPLPTSGDRWLMLGFDDEPLAIVETTEVRLVPAGEVDLAFARDEGEGFESVADWRAAHERFWSEEQLTDETLVVCERFEVVERITPG